MNDYILYLLFLVAVGAILYVVDLKFGVAIKSFFRKRTGETVIGPRDRVGFVYGRRFGSRLNFALVVVAVETALNIMNGQLPYMALFSVLVDLPAVVLGLYLGTFLDRFLVQAQVGIQRVEAVEDRIHRGDTTLGREVGSAVRTASVHVRDQVREQVYPATGSRPTEVPRPTDTAASSPSPSAPAERADDGKGFDEFVSPRKGS